MPLELLEKASDKKKEALESIVMQADIFCQTDSKIILQCNKWVCHKAWALVSSTDNLRVVSCTKEDKKQETWLYFIINEYKQLIKISKSKSVVVNN